MSSIRPKFKSNGKSYLWVDPNEPELSKVAIELLKENGYDFEIVEHPNPDGDTFLPAFFPNKRGEAASSSLADIQAYVDLDNDMLRMRGEHRTDSVIN